MYVFDKMGYIQKIYDHESRQHSQNVEAKLNVPHGVLLDDGGNWLTVCYSDSESHAVESRTPTEASEGHEPITYWRCKDLTGPSALAIKRDQTLIIGDRDDNTISFFRPTAAATQK